jgi:hypothetical protein
MKKLAFCLIATLLSFTLLPLQLGGATIVKTDSLLVSKPFQYTEIKHIRLKTIKIYEIDRSKSNLSAKENLQPEENSYRQHRREINGTLYVSYGIELLITVLVIILL